MLPPVRATSSFVEYQNPGQQQILRQRIDVAGTAPHADGTTSLPISGGRLDIMSLSAQLQLAQGFSIFAETIGKLIKLPRRDGEALLDYARRIMEAVKAMTPAQQAALEKVLNQLVKGISIKLLTEILNNPSGPDAARLAMRLEAAQLLGRDPANSVVSSYRQNAGAEQPQAPMPATKAQGGAPAAPAGGEAEPQAGDTAEHYAAADQGADPTEAGELAKETAAAHDMAGADHTKDAASATKAEANETHQTRASGDEAEAPQSAEHTAADIAEPDPAMAEEVTAEAEHPEKGRGEPATTAQPARRATSSPVFYDGPALARLSQRGMEQQSNTAPTRPTTVAAMTEWLAEAFAESDADLFEPLPAAARPGPEEQTLEELVSRETVSAQRQAAADMAPRTRPGQPAEESQAQAPRPGAATAPGGQATAHATELAEQLALPFILPQQLREGVPLPHVPYPPEERERDPEERKTKPVMETDEDGGEQQSADQGFHGERHDEEDTPDEDGQERAASTEDEGRANDLYWRMAGWN